MAEGTEEDREPPETDESPEVDESAETGASDKRTRPYSESEAERSDVDAMGNDKRREVVGGQYGATVKKRLLVYGVALAIMVAIVVGFLTVVTNVDEKEIALKPTAPWTERGAAQSAPRDVDFKANGPNDTIPAEQIFSR